MNDTREHMMRCLAREILTWPLAKRQKFIREWEFGRRSSKFQRSLPAKGAEAGAELKRYVMAEWDEKRNTKPGKKQIEQLRELLT